MQTNMGSRRGYNEYLGHVGMCRGFVVVVPWRGTQMMNIRHPKWAGCVLQGKECFRKWVSEQ